MHEFLLKTTDKRQFDVKNYDFCEFFIVFEFTRVLFENMVTIATGKVLYIPIQFQNLANKCWEKFQSFRRKSLIVLEIIIQNHPGG